MFKDTIALLWRKKYLFIIIAFTVAILPFAITKESVVLSRAIMTAIAIDYVDDEYVVVGEHFIFNFDPFGVMEREVIVGRGESIDKAIDDIGRNMGKTVSLTHTTIFILGEGLKDKDLADMLIPFAKMPHVRNDAQLFYTTSDIEKLVQASIDTGDARSGRIQQIATYNRKQDHMPAVNLEGFLKDSLRSNSVASIPVLELVDGVIQNDGKVMSF